MPVDLLIKFAQDFAENGYSHEKIKNVFSVNREVRIADISAQKNVEYNFTDVHSCGSKAAEENVLDKYK